MRLFTVLSTVLLVSGLLLLPGGAAQAQSNPMVIGYSQLGTPLLVYHLGTGDQPVFILSGQHGGPERNTVALGNQLWDYFSANPAEIPSNLRLDFMPEGNPDGLVRGR